MAEMAVAAGARKPAPLAPIHHTPQASPSAGAPDRSPLHHHERGSPMKNRMREICTSGSVRDEAGQPPHLLGRRQFLHLAAGTAALPAVSSIVWAQAYPSRPIRLIVGFPPGGGADRSSRLVAPRVSERLGQPVIVENRPGASTNISVQTVVSAPPDGYTVLYIGASAVASGVLFDNLPFNLLRDIVPVA